MFKFMLGFIVGIIVAGSQANADEIRLSSANTVNFRGEVSETSVNEAIIQLMFLNAVRGPADYPLYLVLDTPGGSIIDGLDFIQYAKTVRNLKTITIFAASMGSAIVEALPGERLITEVGVLMFHRARGSFSGQFENGEVEARLAAAKAMVRHMEITNAKRMSISLSKYKAKVKDEWWLFGQDNITQKAADRIVSVSCTQDLVARRDMVAEETLFSTMEVAYSGCPLLRMPIKQAKKEEVEEEAKEKPEREGPKK